MIFNLSNTNLPIHLFKIINIFPLLLSILNLCLKIKKSFFKFYINKKATFSHRKIFASIENQKIY